MTPVPRVLVVDDTLAIHDDFRKIFAPPLASKASARLDNLATAIFNSRGQITVKPEVELDFAFQGQDGLAMVRDAVEASLPYALAFVDMRMPPGWDGLETIPRLWEADPRLQVVICTAFSDHSWPAISKRLGRTDKLIILKKPFDEIEVLQLTQALCEKWRLATAAELKLDQLEAMVAQRTSELEHATAIAEHSNRAKTVFLTTISHELRTPLNGVLGMASLLLQTDLDAEQRDQLQALQASGDRLNTLIEELLNITKIESGQLDLHPRIFRLQDELDCVARRLAPRAAEKKLSFTIDCDPTIPTELVGDPLRLRQILLNLVGNAIKFTDTGSVSLRIKPLDRTSDTLRLRFEIRDTGIGISSEDQARLFQSFAQLDNSTTRRHYGAGLGLSIAQGLIKLMQGTLTVESQPGLGSVFSVALDFKHPSTLPPPAPSIGNTQLASTTEPSSIARILVAEDNLVNQKVIEQHLKRFGFTADIVPNGRDALNAITNQHYHLVFMDCHMPELDGLAATSQIRQRESTLRLARVPIVALTAGVMEEDRAACLLAGMDEYLAKPFSPQAVHAILQRFLPVTTFPS